ncbi:MAG: D-glycero-beta-D-manno-heptose 1,7-bisphosphate 7-phosphatase [Candidatus Omnitrophica bacterium]|nr:D-glycero-beta-D-manno-heptose 1,7-bisphosphate 7-phosphatase [Candidatus Omnitrophota bacterium]
MEKVIFLDRDGVINRDKRDYVRSWDEFDFLPNVFVALRKLTELRYKIIIISNQAGISKGLYTQGSLSEMTEKMLERIRRNSASIHAVHYCQHRDEDNCSCRKPKTGLFKQALLGKAIDLNETFFVGDSQRDIEAGKNLGCKTILVLSGHTKKEQEVLDFKFKPDFVAVDLLDAVESVIEKKEEPNKGRR